MATSIDGGANWDVRDVPGSSLRPYRKPLHYIGLYSNYLHPGTFAIAYYGRERSRGRGFNAHLAESATILDPQPTFVGGHSAALRAGL